MNPKDVFNQTVAEFQASVDHVFLDDCVELAEAKRKDYSGFNHAFANFELVASSTGALVEDVFTFYSHVKPNRLLTISDVDETNFENATGSIQDGINYLLLFYSWYKWSFYLNDLYQPLSAINYAGSKEFETLRLVRRATNTLKNYSRNHLPPDHHLFEIFISAIEAYLEIAEELE